MVAEGAGVRLLTPGDIRELAGRLGVRPSKRLGQNFVVEPGTVRRIAALAALRPEDVVLEVGGGEGVLPDYRAACAGIALHIHRD